MREREYALFDGRNLGQGPVKSQRVDTGTAAFIPVADVERRIVYFAGKVRSALRSGFRRWALMLASAGRHDDALDRDRWTCDLHGR